MKRKIAVVTTSRADYSLLYWQLHDLASHPDVDLKIVALGPHLSPEFGCTVQEIEKDGFHVDARIECLPGCGAAKYPPILAGDHSEERMRQTYGKTSA